MWGAIKDRTEAISFLVGGLTGAVLIDWLARQREVKRASVVAVELPTGDATYETEWEVRGPIELGANEVRVVLRFTPKPACPR